MCSCGAVELPALVDQLAGGRHVQPAEDVEQGGLAAAGRAEQADEFAGVEFEVHAVQRHHVHLAGVIDLAQLPRFEHDPRGNRRRCVGWRIHRTKAT